MQKIQDFRKKMLISPRTMYMRLAQLHERWEALLHSRNLLTFFVFKHDKGVHELAYPKFLTKYEKRPMLLQAFVKHIDNAICVEKAANLAITMTLEHSKLGLKHEPKYLHLQ